MLSKSLENVYCSTVTLSLILLLFMPSDLYDMIIRLHTPGEKIDRGDDISILGGPKIQVAQPKERSTAGFLGDNWHPICSLSTVYSFTATVTFTFTEYLAVRPGSASGN